MKHALDAAAIAAGLAIALLAWTVASFARARTAYERAEAELESWNLAHIGKIFQPGAQARIERKRAALARYLRWCHVIAFLGGRFMIDEMERLSHQAEHLDHLVLKRPV